MSIRPTARIMLFLLLVRRQIFLLLSSLWILVFPSYICQSTNLLRTAGRTIAFCISRAIMVLSLAFYIYCTFFTKENRDNTFFPIPISQMKVLLCRKRLKYVLLEREPVVQQHVKMNKFKISLRSTHLNKYLIAIY